MRHDWIHLVLFVFGLQHLKMKFKTKDKDLKCKPTRSQKRGQNSPTFVNRANILLIIEEHGS